MVKIDFSKVQKSDIPKNIVDYLLSKKSYSVLEDMEYYPFQLHIVKSPFQISENIFDLRECNDSQYFFGCEIVKSVIFTGGGVVSTIQKTDNDLSFIVKGNSEEGFNIFILE